MLGLLRIKNIALIDLVEVEFGSGLNLLTGETGSGKSIIVDSLGALTGERVSSDLIKQGETSATIEGVFSVTLSPELTQIFDETGIEIDGKNEAEIIVKRELSHTGKNRVFINNQLITQGVLKRIGVFLVDIHGQGEQASLFDPSSHLEMLDAFAGDERERSSVAEAFHHYSVTKTELGMLMQNESEKLQMLDILGFQSSEITKAALKPGEETELNEEKRLLNNGEKLSDLSGAIFNELYEKDHAALSAIDRAINHTAELADFDKQFADYREGLQSAKAVIEDLAITARDFRNGLDFSPSRLAEIEDRLAEINRITKKYGGSVESTLDHLAEIAERIDNIQSAELRERELKDKLKRMRQDYIDAALKLSKARRAAAKKYSAKAVEGLRDVSLDKAAFEVVIETPDAFDVNDADVDKSFTAKGFDRVEFLFSANPGESAKPLAKVASGGEASRLMLILKTAGRSNDSGKTAVFDEIDTGIGGRVAESVGQKLKALSADQQVLCVTHQPQVASKADEHFVVEKEVKNGKTSISLRHLTEAERVEEIARMLAGETITDAARENARSMIRSVG